jgi:hypothetical protein
MEATTPVGVLCEDFSSPGAAAPPWEAVLEVLGRAQVYWVSSVRPDGRPHVTPVLGLWADGAFWFCTGPGERKAANLGGNPSCVVTTGTDRLDGMDVVIEGAAGPRSGPGELSALAEGLHRKYGAWFEEPDGTWAGLGRAIRAGDVLALCVRPTRILTFAKGDTFSQTAWSVPAGEPPPT